MEDAVFFFALTLHTHADFATHQMSLQDMNTMGMIVRLIIKLWRMLYFPPLSHSTLTLILLPIKCT